MRLSSRRTTGSLLAAVVFGATAGATAAWPDEVFLRGGGRVSGVIVERTPRVVMIETGPGRVTLPMSRVERIEEGRSALQAFTERAAALDGFDVEGWAALARWADERDLVTQSRMAWERVLAADPRHPEANAGLGRVALDGVYMSVDEANRSRGYVSFEGRWLTPAEHEAAVRERAAEHASEFEAREADLRVREAEARVREAEARAREAEAAAEQPIPTGIPYGCGWGGVIASPLVPSHPLACSHPVGPSHPAGFWRPRPRHPRTSDATPATRPEAPSRPPRSPRTVTQPQQPTPQRGGLVQPPRPSPR